VQLSPFLATREATIDDIADVIANAGGITRAEIGASTLAEDEWIEGFTESLIAGYGIAITANGRPIAVLVHSPGPKGVRHTDFAAKDDFFALGARAALFMRQAVAAIFNEYPEHAFLASTLSPHPEVERWFRVLGLAPAGGRPGGPQHYKGGLHVL
jgi:hypothetical protein